MDRFMSIINLFPVEIRCAIMDGIKGLNRLPEEIRMRTGSQICLRVYGTELLCGSTITKEQMMHVVGNAAEGSFHTAVRHIQGGYIPLKNGGRMGVCGSGAEGRLSSFADVSSICIRVASEAVGCADKLYEELYGACFYNTIIIAPPGGGKTTVLRELIRKLSYAGMYVGVADERGEIAGMYREKPSFDLGPRCDILSGISKKQASMMLLRTMSPDVIAMDEITAFSDASSIMEAVGCGVGLLTTAHGNGIDSLKKPAFRQLYDAMVFEKMVLVEVVNGKREYRVMNLYDETFGSGNSYGNRCRTGVYASK